jgi:hypothetical protein
MIASSALGTTVVLTDCDEPDPDDSTGGFPAARSSGWFSGASAKRLRYLLVQIVLRRSQSGLMIFGAGSEDLSACFSSHDD